MQIQTQTHSTQLEISKILCMCEQNFCNPEDEITVTMERPHWNNPFSGAGGDDDCDDDDDDDHYHDVDVTVAKLSLYIFL